MKRNHVYDFFTFYSDTFPLILVFYAAFSWRIFLLFSSNRRWIDTDTINWYYQSCWLPIASIYQLKIFHFWLIVSIIGCKKKHRLKIFSSSQDHRSNQFFFTVNWLSVLIQSMFADDVKNWVTCVREGRGIKGVDIGMWGVRLGPRAGNRYWLAAWDWSTKGHHPK